MAPGPNSSPALAYLFERYPSFVQLFTLREVEGLHAWGLTPTVFSVRGKDQGELAEFSPTMDAACQTFPDKAGLASEVRELAARRLIPKQVLPFIQEWGNQPDKQRLYEAAWIGAKLRSQGVGHVHAHFAGLAARTGYWIKRFFGMSYSFTAHANDFLVRPKGSVDLETLFAEARLVVTVSDFSAALLKKRYPRTRRIVRVYNGMQVPEAPSTDPGANPKKIVAVGRLVEKKGFEDLLRACAALGDDDWTVEIVGDGPRQTSLLALRDNLGLTNRVKFLGSMTESQVTEVLHGGRVFALPCVQEQDGGMDNLPTVITEAMAAGLPVVSTRLAGVPEQVCDGFTGVLVQPSDIQGLTHALRKYLSSPNLASEHGRGGHRRAREIFSLEQTIPHLASVFLKQTPTRLRWKLVRRKPLLVGAKIFP
ncbi:MAG: glycosyltransferase family 4 protein [Verrucomicrobiales bacterium]